MERVDFFEQARLLVTRGSLRSPGGEALATRRRGGGAPASVQASRIDFSLPVTNTTARRGHARERRKTSQACRGNCGDFVDTLVGAIRLACCDDFALARYTRSGGLDPTFREAWKGPERLRFPLADESRYSPPDGEAVERARDLADGAMAQSADGPAAKRR